MRQRYYGQSTFQMWKLRLREAKNLTNVTTCDGRSTWNSHVTCTINTQHENRITHTSLTPYIHNTHIRHTHVPGTLHRHVPHTHPPYYTHTEHTSATYTHIHTTHTLFMPHITHRPHIHTTYALYMYCIHNLTPYTYMCMDLRHSYHTHTCFQVVIKAPGMLPALYFLRSRCSELGKGPWFSSQRHGEMS